MAGSFPDTSSEEEENHNAAESVPSDAQTDQEPISYSSPSYPSMAGGWPSSQSSDSSASDDGDGDETGVVGSGDVGAGSGSIGGVDDESHASIENIQTSDDLYSPTLGASSKTDHTPHASDSHLETSGSSSRSGHADISGKTQSVNTGSETGTVTPPGTESATEDHTLTPPASAYSNGVNSPTQYTRGSDAHSSDSGSESGRNSPVSSASSNTEEPYPQSPMQSRRFSSRIHPVSLRPAPLNLIRRRHSDTPFASVTDTGSPRDTVYTPAPLSFSRPSAKPSSLFGGRSRRNSAPETSADSQSTPGQSRPTYTEQSEESQMPSPSAYESSAVAWGGVNWGKPTEDYNQRRGPSSNSRSTELSPGGSDSAMSPLAQGRRSEGDTSLDSSTGADDEVPDSLQNVDWSGRDGDTRPASVYGRGSSAETVIHNPRTPEQTVESNSEPFDASSIAPPVSPPSPTPPHVHTLISDSSAGRTTWASGHGRESSTDTAIWAPKQLAESHSEPFDTAPVAVPLSPTPSHTLISKYSPGHTGDQSSPPSPPFTPAPPSPSSDSSSSSTSSVFDSDADTQTGYKTPLSSVGSDTTRHSDTAAPSDSDRRSRSIERDSTQDRSSGIVTKFSIAPDQFSRSSVSNGELIHRTSIIQAFAHLSSHKDSLTSRYTPDPNRTPQLKSSSSVSSGSSLGSDEIGSYAPTDPSDPGTHPSSPASTGFRKSNNTGDQPGTSSDGSDTISFDNLNIHGAASWISDSPAQSSPAGRGSLSGRLTSLISASSTSFVARHATNVIRRYRYSTDSLNQGTGDDSGSSAGSSNSFIPSRSMSSRHFGKIKARATEHLTSVFTRKDRPHHQVETDFDSLCGRSDEDSPTAEFSNPYSNPSARTGSSRHLGELRGRFAAQFKSAFSQTSASHQQDKTSFDSLCEFSGDDSSPTGLSSDIPAMSTSRRYIDKARNKFTAASTSLFGNDHTNNISHYDQSSRLVSGITGASSRMSTKSRVGHTETPKLLITAL